MKDKIVPFEIAKRIKKQGFNEETESIYNCDGHLIERWKEDMRLNFYYAPTIERYREWAISQSTEEEKMAAAERVAATRYKMTDFI